MIEVPKAFMEGQWFYGLFTAAFSLLVFLRLFYPAVFYRDIFMALTFVDSRADMREQKKWRSYDILVDILFSCLIAIFYMLSLREFNIFEEPSPQIFINFALAVLCLLTAKYMLDIFLSWLFNIKDYFKSIYEKITALRLLAVIILLPLLFILYYSGLWNEISGPVFLLCCFSFIFLLHFVFIGKFLLPKPADLLFFILYLCTVEIGPLLALLTLL